MKWYKLFILGVIFMNIAEAKLKDTEIRVIMTTEAVVFDPLLCKGYQQFQVINLFLDTLVRKDPKFGIVSGIASKWDINVSQKEYTFYISPKAKFHNGENIKSSDIKFSFDRHSKIGSPSVIGSFLRNILEKIEIVNDSTIKFILKGSYPPFLELLSMSGYGIISEKSIGDTVIGSGPFLKAESKDGLVCLEKDKSYPFETTNIEKFCIRIERDVDKTVESLNSLETQIAMGSPLEVALSPKLKSELVSNPTFSLVSTHVYLNHNTKYLKSKKNRELVRSVVLKAREKKDLLTKFDSQLDTFIPNGIMLEEYYKDEKPSTKVEIVKKEKLRIVFPYGIFLESSVKAIVSEFEKAGFDVTYLNVKGKDLLAPIQSGEFDLIFIPYQGVIPDPDGYLDLLSETSIMKMASIPASSYLKELDAVRFSKDRKERLQSYGKILRKFEMELHVIPFSQNSIPIVYNSKLKLPNLNYSFHLNLRELNLK